MRKRENLNSLLNCVVTVCLSFKLALLYWLKQGHILILGLRVRSSKYNSRSAGEELSACYENSNLVSALNGLPRVLNLSNISPAYLHISWTSLRNYRPLYAKVSKMLSSFQVFQYKYFLLYLVCACCVAPLFSRPYSDFRNNVGRQMIKFLFTQFAAAFWYSYSPHETSIFLIIRDHTYTCKAAGKITVVKIVQVWFPITVWLFILRRNLMVNIALRNKDIWDKFQPKVCCDKLILFSRFIECK